MKRRWFQHAFWNTLEQGFTQAADRLTGFVLIYVLQKDLLGALVVAQAWAAPTLLLFLTPEGAIYRDLAGWKREGPDHVASRLRALRLFAWWKVGAALAAGLLLAIVLHGGGGYPQRLAAALWAYFIAVGPQIAGPDREFLRMELRLRTLNLLSLLQKSLLLGGTILVSVIVPGSLAWLALVAAIASIASALVGRSISRAVLREQGASAEGLRGAGGPPVRETLARTLATFTIWQHLSATATTWIRTMDLFFLGAFRFPARELGLYGASLKIGNLVTAIPFAGENLFAVWLGRSEGGRPKEERRIVTRVAWLFALGAALTACGIALLLPLLLPILSHGRWTPEEIERMTGWIHWMLGAGVLFATARPLLSWQLLRTSASRLLFGVFVPWTVAAVALFALAAGFGGPDRAARTALAVAAVGTALALFRFWRVR